MAESECRVNLFGTPYLFTDTTESHIHSQTYHFIRKVSCIYCLSTVSAKVKRIYLASLPIEQVAEGTNKNYSLLNDYN
jgi:hypothetical protein